MTPRSVYLHNNKLADAGLPDNMFNGSSNVEILILSSNFLRHVPKHLPPALYKLHLKVRGAGGGGEGKGRAGSGLGLENRDMQESEGSRPQGTEALTLHLPLLLGSLPFRLQNNKLEKIPPGAFSELSNLRELYLQNNYLTDEGLDNETFW